MQPTQQKAWRAGRFWWDWPAQTSESSEAEVRRLTTLSAVIFDLDALADIDSAGHRLAFNAAFAELGLDIEWSVARYRQLQALTDERRRVAAELRKRGVCTECDVLAELLVDEICATKAMILGETILDADITARPGMVELIAEAYGAGIGVGLVSTGNHSWVEPLVRQLVGEGMVRTIITADEVPLAELYRTALAELGAPAYDSLAFAGSQASQRAAVATGVATVYVEGDGAALRVADCQRMHDSWHETHRRPTAA
ncbi:HAD hydrolase-like protein [Mycolicibacterium austroafricanum]|uniref:HAD hydrolase-like protein n=1 Tax=Mycolicibacterium austroafricanum TaxID=39687 RepID=A0ABT8H829_MYCAO|nr:HAD family hydrolase [Mycolicibacterium austroafricanum]MDN4516907.1 HAD hydrolase-like protein [Mycolicibacterium austroafricanum]QRZ08009.1 HAD hydrolase-like protein [Mycolicibacterium austroafricanum]QZT69672.1 HAD hydrolase-like protein [Mycolicibacterium austroafricanum]